MPPLRQQPSRIDRPSPLTPETQPRNTRDDIRLPIVKIRTSGTWRAVIVDGGRATVLASPSSWERRLSSGQSRHQSLASIHDEDDQVRQFERPATVNEDELVKGILAGAEHSPRIDESKRRPQPLRRLRNDVPCGAGDRRDD